MEESVLYKLSYFILYCSAYSVLLPTLSFVFFRGNYNRTLQMLGLYIILSCICEAASVYTTSRGIYNYFIGHVYVPGEIITVSLAYYFALNGRKLKKALLGLAALALIISLLDSVFWNPFLTSFNSYGQAASSVLTLLLVLLYFRQLLNELRVVSLEHDPLFLASVGFLLYYAGTFFYFLVQNYIVTDETSWMSWPVHGLLNILNNTLFALCFWLSWRHRPVLS